MTKTSGSNAAPRSLAEAQEEFTESRDGGQRNRRRPWVDLIAGARPNFMKIAPIVAALRAIESNERPIGYRIVHTGQHYDTAMSGAFFEQLGIPAPDVNLEAGSGSHATQTAAIMTRYETLLEGPRPDLCIVVGDVNSTMACAITAQKQHVPVAHVEGGLRSGDWRMPEEINRLATDAVSDWFFTTSEHANANLRRAGVEEHRIHFVGNTMIDTLLANLPKLRPASFWEEIGLDRSAYAVVTLHRPANVDDPSTLRALLEAISAGVGERPTIFPVHPRTARVIERLGRLPAGLRLVEPQPYLEFIHLVKHASVVVTDSGGLTEETTVLQVPCLTLRDTTERPETVEVGTNQLLGRDPELLRSRLAEVFNGTAKEGRLPPLWDGRAGERIVDALARILSA
jgi:UDP-N-acetylglucosamine 2-epimerase (non-hydrolysing)